jgi:hypothetical protein
MKMFFAILAALILADIARADELVPEDAKTPLFVIYEMHWDVPAKDAPTKTHSAHADKAVLTVYSLSDMLLQADKKGVRVVLNEKDAKTFAELTRAHDWLLLQADKSTGVIMHIRGPIEDGSILLDDSTFGTAVAAYLRRRFHVKPNSNEMEPVKPTVIQPDRPA